jgi:hypothetical protein
MIEFDSVKIEIFIPAQFVKPLNEELNQIGVGHIGNYDHCMSVAEVKGYWRPLAGAAPYLGVIGEISEGQECKVEVNCQRQYVAAAIKTIRRVHPYEEPVINIIPLVNSLFE